jgi:stearoyl-CoA desaturase (delta-9 desaturase)
MLFTLLVAIGAGFAVTLIANVATTVFLHRSLSHRALTLSRPVRFAFRVLTWITTGIRPRQWVAVHRKHHAFTDVEGDPHSPVLLGWVRVQLKNVALYRREATNPATVTRYAKDLPADRWDRVLFDRALLGLGLGIALLVLAFGPVAGVLAAFVHVNLYLGGSAAVNAIGHHFGRKPYPNGAGNLQWLAFLTAGEGLHNNHHAAPTSAKLAHRWYEIDPGWYVIRLLTWLRLARVRLSELRLAHERVPATTGS